MAGNSVRSRRDTNTMEERRLAALPRPQRGESLASIARQLGVSRQAGFVWAERWRRRGESGWRRRPRPGRPTKLARARLAPLPGALGSRSCLPSAAPLRLERAEAGSPRSRTRPGRHPALGETPWAGLEKKAQILKATLVFLDESGFSLRPTPCKTWAPCGQTPVLYHGFNWPKRSALSALTPNPHAYLRLLRGTLTRPQVIAFVRHLLRWIPGTVFLFWDGLNTHRSKMTRAALAVPGG